MNAAALRVPLVAAVRGGFPSRGARVRRRWDVLGSGADCQRDMPRTIAISGSPNVSARDA
eukprot:364964-Chlamydomonas_euryale.AAC.14